MTYTVTQRNDRIKGKLYLAPSWHNRVRIGLLDQLQRDIGQGRSHRVRPGTGEGDGNATGFRDSGRVEVGAARIEEQWKKTTLGGQPERSQVNEQVRTGDIVQPVRAETLGESPTTDRSGRVDRIG